MVCLKCLSKYPYPKKPVLSWKVPGYAPLTLILTFHPNFHPNIWVSANLSIYKKLIHDNISLVFWKQRIFSLVLLLRRSKIIFINVVLILPITVITSLILKLHWLSTAPDQLRIGSQSIKCWEMVEWKQRVQKFHRFDIETTCKYCLRELINISSSLKVKSTLKFPRRIAIIIYAWIRLSKLIKSWRTFHMEFRRWVDGKLMNMCPLGSFDVRAGSARWWTECIRLIVE